MGQRLLITEDEKKRILNLYEQGEISTDTEPNDENLIQFLKDNGYVENSNYLGTWEIKKDDGSFGATLVLNPDKKTINKSTILGPQDIISSIQETFNKFSIPVIVTDGKLLSRAPFDNKDIIKTIADFVKSEDI
jgi:hypothetical protein|tara:strand:- start:3 stop:404 length:402 start_codon:yes stop_codon:yes gene_type:complete